MSALTAEPARRKCVALEPFNGGSHAQLLRWLGAYLDAETNEWYAITLPAKKWHWRLIASSVHLAQRMPRLATGEECTLFATSMVNLAEVLALRPDYAQPSVHKVLYMHENQLTYPVQYARSSSASGGSGSGSSGGAAEAGASSSAAAAAATTPATATPAPAAEESQQREFQYGWAQLLSCAVADVIAWNSCYNRDSFAAALPTLARTVPDAAQRVDAAAVVAAIKAKSVIAYFPVPRPVLSPAPDSSTQSGPLRIGWNHRWEYDKGPQLLFDTLRHLVNKNVPFQLVLLGEQFASAPPVFAEARSWLPPAAVAHWGFAASREEYYRLLSTVDVVLSTAQHEFFGVAIAEAVLCGAYPLCPADLSYPELLCPAPEEEAAVAAGPGTVAALLRPGAPRQSMFPLPETSTSSGGSAGSGGGGGGRQGGGRGARYFPPSRPSPHLYTTHARLRDALSDMARQPQRVREWRQQLLRALDEVARPASSASATAAAAATEGSDAAEPAAKRARLDGDSSGSTSSASGKMDPYGTAEQVARAVHRFSDAVLWPLYAQLLT